jgi:hypothetical protein
MLPWTNLLQLMLIIPFTTAGVSLHDPFYCYTSDPIKPQLERFSHLTSYETARGNSFNPSVSTCTPSKFWFVSRYGTRLPNTGEINDIINNHERFRNDIISNYYSGRTSLCRGDFAALRSWEFDTNITTSIQQRLTAAGWNEFEGIGRRFAQSFPTLLPASYSPERHLFRTTHQSRTRSSLEAFADGVFGQDGHLQVQFEDTPDPDGDDLLLRPHNACPLYNEVAANGTEFNAFTNGPEYQQALTQISQKLGFHGYRQLRREDIHILGNLCRYEQIWNMSTPSPWCASSSVANHAVLEYFRDLE